MGQYGVVLPPDDHVHSEWSYDTGPQASMIRSCEQALAAGIPAVAFTEHLDFSVWRDGDLIGEQVSQLSRRIDGISLDLDGYHECVQQCRERFPDLRILSGVEAGEPHLFAKSLSVTLSGAPVDRILGSLHGVIVDGQLRSMRWLFDMLPPEEVARRYFEELLRVIAGSDLFQVLAHVDFPRRYWPRWLHRYDENAFEEEYRTVFAALAGSGRVLEINTRSPLASVAMIRWWRDEGGGAVSFGSDAHVPGRVGEYFELATDIAEAAGFRPGRDRFDFWRS